MSERHIAGHATHFLRRLDRASDAHVELALTLYRDPELLREVLQRAKLPAGAERVAISLAEVKARAASMPPPGPYVVVTCEGRFVTCLAEGMSPGDLPVVDRTRVDVAAASVERMRERLAAIDALDGKEREAERLFEKPQKCGPQLAREDFEALARWEPLWGAQFFSAALETEVQLMQLLPYMLTLRPKRVREPDRVLLRAWWDAFWGWSHTMVLANVGEARERMRSFDEVLRAREEAQLLERATALRTSTIAPLSFGILGPSTRALWIAGRHARLLLPVVKRPPTGMTLTERAVRDLPLATIAMASAKLRAEAEGALGARAQTAGSEWDASDAIWQRQMIEPLRQAIAAGSDAGRVACDEEGRALVHCWLEASPERRESAPITVRAPEDVPVDVARAAIATLEQSYAATDEDWLDTLVQTIPWAARAEPNELFAPRAWCAAIGTEYDDDEALALLARLGDIFGGKTETRRVEKTPGRNDPCSCGSGKKYKRCCGARA